jgi:hypothetical protein
MDPQDRPYHELLETGRQPIPGPDDLRAIVARAGRRRWRAAGAAAAVALAVGGAVGGVVGYSTSNHAKGNVQTASSPAVSSGAASSPANAGGTSQAITLPSLVRLAPLFTRSANGVDIRAYQNQLPVFRPATTCQNQPAAQRGLQAEVSTAKAVGIADWFGGTSPQTSMVGQAEGAPTAVVIASVNSSVAQAKMTFAGGAVDAMKPVGGWVVLAGPVPAATKAPVGVMTTYGAGGRQLSSASVQLGGFGPPPMQALPACGTCPPPLLKPGAPAAGGGAPAAGQATPLPGRNSASPAVICQSTAPPATAGAGTISGGASK